MKAEPMTWEEYQWLRWRLIDARKRKDYQDCDRLRERFRASRIAVGYLPAGGVSLRPYVGHGLVGYAGWVFGISADELIP